MRVCWIPYVARIIREVLLILNIRHLNIMFLNPLIGGGLTTPGNSCSSIFPSCWHSFGLSCSYIWNRLLKSSPLTGVLRKLAQKPGITCKKPHRVSDDRYGKRHRRQQVFVGKYWDLLTPKYALGCKVRSWRETGLDQSSKSPQRKILDPGYLKALHRENVYLTDDRIVSLSKGGLVTKSGKQYPADVIVGYPSSCLE